jgi:hypothetical protein
VQKCGVNVRSPADPLSASSIMKGSSGSNPPGSSATRRMAVIGVRRGKAALSSGCDELRDTVRRVRTRTPFHIDAGRPPRPHARGPRPWGRCRKTMPISGPVTSEQGRVRVIAAARRAAITCHDPPRRTRHFAAAVLEQTIRDDRDFAAHIDHIRISTRSSMVSWRTRRTGIRHFAAALPAECVSRRLEGRQR